MKPFDLEAALAGAPVKTKAGDKIEQIAYFPNAEKFQVIALRYGDAEILQFTRDGICSLYSELSILMMAPLFELDGKEYYLGDYVRERLPLISKEYRLVQINTQNMKAIVAARASNNLKPPVVKYAQMYMDPQGKIHHHVWDDEICNLVLCDGGQWLGEPVIIQPGAQP